MVAFDEVVLFLALAFDGIVMVVFVGLIVVPLVIVECVVAFVVEEVSAFVACEEIIKYNQLFEPM